MNEIKNYGFVLNTLEDLSAYRLGAIELPKIVLRKDGQYDEFLPKDELQHTPSFDSFGCTVYGTENVQQTLERLHGFPSKEYDERYNYNLAKISPPGADPHAVADIFRLNGVVSGVFPMTQTLEEYSKPRPMPKKYVDQGVAHPHELRHQWLWQRSQDKETRTKLIKEYLQYSPLGVSVTAWKLRDGVYVSDGQSNTHWTMLYGWNNLGWKIYDSYAPHKKTLSFDHNIEVCKRYILVPNSRQKQIGIIEALLVALKKLFAIKVVEEAKPAPVVPPKPVPSESASLLERFCKAVQEYEGFYPGSRSFRNNNPGNCKYSPVGYDTKYGIVKKDAQGFAIFKDYETGWLYLNNFVRNKAIQSPNSTIVQFIANVYAPASDNNNPIKYAEFIAKKLGITVDYKLKILV